MDITRLLINFTSSLFGIAIIMFGMYAAISYVLAGDKNIKMFLIVILSVVMFQNLFTGPIENGVCQEDGCCGTLCEAVVETFTLSSRNYDGSGVVSAAPLRLTDELCETAAVLTFMDAEDIEWYFGRYLQLGKY